jgi:ABC-type sugar transport system ATPase subunit
MSLLEMKVPVVRFRSVSKEFPGVLAADSLDLDILPGEVHVVGLWGRCPAYARPGVG